MADSVVHIGENSPEQVAYKMMGVIASSEGFSLIGQGQRPSREWIIRTYAQCIFTVRQGSPSYVGDAIEMGD
jgi:hypothetical protein